MFFLTKILQYIKNNILSTNKQDEESLNNHQNNNLLNQQTMAMFNYGVGGNEVKVDANEAIQEIQENKTLLVSQLTTDEPISPEIVTGLKTVNDVFRHFRPSISVDHETAEGENVTEEFAFKNLADFTPKVLVQNSAFLKNLSLEQEQYNNIIRQLRNNKLLNKLLNDPDAKAAFIEELKSIASELENNQE